MGAIEELYRATEKNDIPASVDAHLRSHRLLTTFLGTASCRVCGLAERPSCVSTSRSTHRTYNDPHDIAAEHERLAATALEGDMDGFRQELATHFKSALQGDI
jgi:hypothetical protein